MASLFVVGNLREFTFANSIVAADRQCRRRYNAPLRRVFVFHSPQSRTALAESSAWREFLASQGIDQGIIVEHMVDLQAEGAATGLAADLVEDCLKALRPDEPIFVDLTNGDSLYKNVFSTLSFLVGAQHPFVLLSARLLGDPTSKPGGNRADQASTLAKRFWQPEELDRAYQALPDPTDFDRLGPEWLTEVRRFGLRAAASAQALEQALGNERFHREDFEAELRHAVGSWFRGVKSGNSALLGSSVRSIGRALEEMLEGVEGKLHLGREKVLEKRIGKIQRHLNQQGKSSDSSLLIQMSTLLRIIRNQSTHKRSTMELALIRASLSAELLFDIANFFVALFDRRGPSEEAKPAIPDVPEEVTALERVVSSGRPGKRYFFGIDGDDTGRHLERLFSQNAGVNEFKEFSGTIQAAIKEVTREACKPPIKAQVLFSAGDDLLFRGTFDPSALERLRGLYRETSGGRTCSIGFGTTPKAAYVALKMAKASPGKDAVVGVVLDGEDKEP